MADKEDGFGAVEMEEAGAFIRRDVPITVRRTVLVSWNVRGTSAPQWALLSAALRQGHMRASKNACG
jgi:hypothetical protein